MINFSAKCGAESKETTRIFMQIERKAPRARKGAWEWIKNGTANANLISLLFMSLLK